MSEIDSIASTNNVAGNAPVIDHSWHRFSDTSGPNLGVGTASFSDMLDVVNPLQHIPVVSAIYRAVTGDQISPAARIAGDALYGAAMGVASAGLSALGAIGDEIYAAANDGQSASQTIVAALFGKGSGQDDSDKNIQLADAAATQTPDTQTQALQVAALQTPAKQSPILDMPDLAPAAGLQAAALQPASTPATPAATAIASNTPSATATAIEGGKSLALDRSKLAYGGVMDPAMMQNAMQNQTLALTLAAGQSNMQAAHALRNARFATNTASPATGATAQSASLPLPGETPSLAGIASPPAANNSPGMAASPITTQAQNVAVTPAQILAQASQPSTAQSLPPGLNQSVPQEGLNTLKVIKGLDQYRTTAARVPVPFIGSAVDVTN